MAIDSKYYEEIVGQQDTVNELSEMRDMATAISERLDDWLFDPNELGNTEPQVARTLKRARALTAELTTILTQLGGLA